MIDRGESDAGSNCNYRGIRATITVHPSREVGHVHLSTKSAANSWAEWDSISAAERVDLSGVTDLRGALLALAAAITEHAERL